MLEFFRAWLAALLTGRADLQKFLHLLGAGGTGKGAFIRLCVALVGPDNAAVTDLRNLEQNRFETAALYGKRLVAITDSSKYGGSVDVFKALTGQDPLRLERKNQQQGNTFIFDGLVVLASNEALQTTDFTSALERRRLTVPFQRIASDRERQWDAEGGETAVLHAEIPGLVNWALALSRDEVTRIITERPKALIRANLEALRAGNPIASWLMDSCIPEPEHRGKVGVRMPITRDGCTIFQFADEWFYPNYLTWCQRNACKPISLQTFSSHAVDLLRMLKFEAVKRRRNVGAVIIGLRLRRETESIYPWESENASQPVDSESQAVDCDECDPPGEYPVTTQVFDYVESEDREDQANSFTCESAKNAKNCNSLEARVAELIAQGWAPWNATARADSEARERAKHN